MNKDKSTRQTGPAKGQRYWFIHYGYTDSCKYNDDAFDVGMSKIRDIYPEKRFAEAEFKAKELIVGVNKLRRELNGGMGSVARTHYAFYWSGSGLGVREAPVLAHARGIAYPFGLFKDIADCKMCINEFDDELEWFYTVYLPLMEELDDYDWAKAPGWGGEV